MRNTRPVVPLPKPAVSGAAAAKAKSSVPLAPFSTGPGGIASLASVCVTGRKAQGVTGLPSPIGDVFDLDFLSHELGHQFSANHTFNSVTGGCAGNRNGSTAYEPGGGTTIMGYTTQCGADQITTVPDRLFHASALDEMFAFMYTSSGNSCPIKVPTGNYQPKFWGTMAQTLSR